MRSSVTFHLLNPRDASSISPEKLFEIRKRVSEVINAMPGVAVINSTQEPSL
jgi:hypothetical protein